VTTGWYEEVPVAEWGRRVEQARQALGLSQRALARRTGVTQQTISKVETGRMCPHDRVKVRLARALESHPADLFRWTPRDGQPREVGWEPVAPAARSQPSSRQMS
jgi:transcriptional regulator with XRE-family HTH domain